MSKFPCIAEAFAKACDVSVEYFIEHLDKLGGRFKGTYHHQQCMDVALCFDYISFSIECNPQIVESLDPKCKPQAITFPEGNEARFNKYLDRFSGVLGGLILAPDKQIIGHAVTWQDSVIYDPRGSRYFREEAKLKPNYFYANNFIALIKV